MENDDFIYTGFFDVKLCFTLKGLVIQHTGLKYIKFKGSGE